MIRIDAQAIWKVAFLCSLAALIPVFGHSVFYQIGTSEDGGDLVFGQDLYGLATAPGRALLVATPWAPLTPTASYHGPFTQFQLYVATMAASAVGWLGIFLLLGWLLRVVRRAASRRIETSSSV